MITELPDGTFDARFHFDDIELLASFATRSEAEAWLTCNDQRFYGDAR